MTSPRLSVMPNDDTLSATTISQHDSYSPPSWNAESSFAIYGQEYTEEKVSAEELAPYRKLFVLHDGDLRAMFDALGEDPG